MNGNKNPPKKIPMDLKTQMMKKNFKMIKQKTCCYFVNES